jgi:hypothetical protein
MLTPADGTLHPITATGAFTVSRLRLNRPPLVEHRRRTPLHAEQQRLLTRYRDVAALLEKLHARQAALLEEHRLLLEQQRAALKVLPGGAEG